MKWNYGTVLAAACCVFMMAGGISAESITLTWLAPGDDGSTGTALNYELRMSTERITDGSWRSAQPVPVPYPKPAGTVERVTIYGLNPDVPYFFALKAVDEAGNWSEMTNVVTNIVCDSPCLAYRGNVDSDPLDEVNVADLSYLVDFLFHGGPPPICMLEANIDGDPYEEVTVMDVTALISYLFDLSVDMLPPCPSI